MSSKARRLKRDLKKHPEFLASIERTNNEVTNIKLSMIKFHTDYTRAYKKDKINVADTYLKYVEDFIGKDILDRAIEISKDVDKKKT
jgi:hypothetical protein|tara:strand:+ start:559 stop:819 length:261 start_codon:yes stop_codon:yes gene_type:complete